MSKKYSTSLFWQAWIELRRPSHFLQTIRTERRHGCGKKSSQECFADCTQCGSCWGGERVLEAFQITLSNSPSASVQAKHHLIATIRLNYKTTRHSCRLLQVLSPWILLSSIAQRELLLNRGIAEPMSWRAWVRFCNVDFSGVTHRVKTNCKLCQRIEVIVFPSSYPEYQRKLKMHFAIGDSGVPCRTDIRWGYLRNPNFANNRWEVCTPIKNGGTQVRSQHWLESRILSKLLLAMVSR